MHCRQINPSCPGGASNRRDIASSRGVVLWGLIVMTYLLSLQHWLTDVFHATTARGLPVRISISLAVVVPLGFLLGFAFPTGMKLVEVVDEEPTPWFWGINAPPACWRRCWRSC